MKRVLIFSLAYYPHVGGAEVAIKEITERCSECEFELITLRFRGEPQEEHIGRVRVHRVGSGASYFQKILFVPRAVRLALELHQKNPFQGLWAMMCYMLFPIVLMRLRGVRIPYLLTLQEGDPFAHVFGRLHMVPFLPLLRYGFRHASAVQAISTYLADWAIEIGFPGTPEVIPNGVDSKHFTGLPVAHAGTVLVTASRLVHKNAIDDVIRALALLPVQITFTVLGAGPDEQSLTELAERLGVASRVRFEGYVDHAGLPAYLHQSDIFIRPSRSEGMGNSFIEAMAAGLPVIATQEGGISDFLFDAKRNPDKETTGWAVDKNAPEQIAAVVREILSNPEQGAKVVATAKKMAIEKYDWNLIAEKMKAIFDRVID